MNRLILPAVLAGAALLLAACSSQPPTPDWQMNAHGAAQKATEAYLSGDTRVAQLEWSRARAEVARTGRPDLLARVELLRCAAEAASLGAAPCTLPAAVTPDLGAAEQAYAAYLRGAVNTSDIALLPAAQRAAASDAGAIAQIADPLSRLVAAGAALRAGRATPDTLVLATDTASAQGWRRPLLAWLLLRADRAAQAGDTEAAAALRRRIDLVEHGGQR